MYSEVWQTFQNSSGAIQCPISATLPGQYRYKCFNAFIMYLDYDVNDAVLL